MLLMDIMPFMEAMGTSGIPVIAAFFIGLMTAISPCPLATNITAIAAVFRNMGRKRRTFLAGLAYTLGRVFTYAAIASLIVWAGLNTQAISLFLQGYGNYYLGPLLVAVGVLMLAASKLPSLSIKSERIGRFKESLTKRGLLGGFLLGAVFALAFCPFSALLFFGMLIPLALAAGDAILIPSVFAFATGLPVIVFSMLLTTSVSKAGSAMGKVQSLEKWVRIGASLIFIAVGLYYSVVFNLG